MLLQQPHHNAPIVVQVEQLRERVQAFPNARSLTAELQKDQALCVEIKAIYYAIFNRQLSGCVNCISDAVFEILNTKNIMEKAKLEYWLPAGALLQDVVNMDSKKAMSNANINEELCLYHLATNPGCERRFVRLPQDWQERVQAYKQSTMQLQEGTAEDASEEVKEKVEPKPKAKRATKKPIENKSK